MGEVIGSRSLKHSNRAGAIISKHRARQKTSINLGLGTGCGPAFVQSLLIGSCAVPMFLKPLIGFTTSTSLLTSLMVVFSHVG